MVSGAPPPHLTTVALQRHVRMTGNDNGKLALKRSWPVGRHHADTGHEGLRKAVTHQSSRCVGRDTKRALVEHKRGVLLPHQSVLLRPTTVGCHFLPAYSADLPPVGGVPNDSCQIN